MKLLRATPHNKKPKRSKTTTAQLADRSQASIVANQICRLKWMPLNKITSDIRRSRRGLELCGLASLQNKERQFCVFLPEKGFPACNVFVQTDSQQAAQIIVQLFSCCWFRNRTTKSVRGIMNSDPGNQDVQPRTLPAFLGLVYGSVEILLDSPDPRESCLGHVSGVLSGQSVKTVALRTSANLIRYNSCDRGVRHVWTKIRRAKNGKNNT